MTLVNFYVMEKGGGHMRLRLTKWEEAVQNTDIIALASSCDEQKSGKVTCTQYGG